MRVLSVRVKKYLQENIIYLVKWVILSVLVGIVVGIAGTGFYYTLKFVTGFRTAHHPIIVLLPLAGLLIVYLYRTFNGGVDKGTNLLITSITGRDKAPLAMAPLIFVSTALTHLFGGSAGRESAVLQIGGGIAHNMARLFPLDEGDVRIMTMCGMSAGFAALFGTPFAAAFLAIEISSVGILYYASLMPCALSALTAAAVASRFGTVKDAFILSIVPDFTIYRAFVTGLLTILCALVSILFCVAIHKTHDLFARYFRNPYIRIFAGGLIVVLLSFLLRTDIYNGGGMPVIEAAVEGHSPKEAFFFKLLLTAITMGAGFKGGEIVPSLYIGATFGSAFAQILHFDPALCAAIGMAALFCGITNCPIASLLICFEMFGYEGMPYYLITIALSYTFSGYYSVYSSQKIVYSKYHTKYVNKKANEHGEIH